MRIGIYGGSFNPIHKGHMKIAKSALKNLNLDKLFIIPLGKPAHKTNDMVSGIKRKEMCELAFKDNKKIEVLDIEIKKNKISYTYETLMELKEKYPEAEFFEIIGEDSAQNFTSWRNYENILKNSKIVVYRREGYINNLLEKNIINIQNDFYKISSTEIREKVKKGENIDSFVDEKVREYIEKNRLYR